MNKYMKSVILMFCGVVLLSCADRTFAIIEDSDYVETPIHFEVDTRGDTSYYETRLFYVVDFEEHQDSVKSFAESKICDCKASVMIWCAFIFHKVPTLMSDIEVGDYVNYDMTEMVLYYHYDSVKRRASFHTIDQQIEMPSQQLDLECLY